MYIDTPSTHYPGENAILNTPKFNFIGETCLIFFYHMYGDTIGTLRVIINGTKTVFSESGQKGNRWLEAWINVSFSGIGMVSSISETTALS